MSSANAILCLTLLGINKTLTKAADLNSSNRAGFTLLSPLWTWQGRKPCKNVLPGAGETVLCLTDKWCLLCAKNCSRNPETIVNRENTSPFLVEDKITSICASKTKQKVQGRENDIGDRSSTMSEVSIQKTWVGLLNRGWGNNESEPLLPWGHAHQEEERKQDCSELSEEEQKQTLLWFQST